MNPAGRRETARPGVLSREAGRKQFEYNRINLDKNWDINVDIFEGFHR